MRDTSRFKAGRALGWPVPKAEKDYEFRCSTRFLAEFARLSCDVGFGMKPSGSWRGLTHMPCKTCFAPDVAKFFSAMAGESVFATDGWSWIVENVELGPPAIYPERYGFVPNPTERVSGLPGHPTMPRNPPNKKHFHLLRLVLGGFTKIDVNRGRQQ